MQKKKSVAANLWYILHEDEEKKEHSMQRVAQYFPKALKFKHEVNEIKERYNIEAAISLTLERLLKNLNEDHV